MELKTYRAKTIHEALALVRRDLGPDAAVLGTREVRGTGGMLGWLRGDRLIEVTASAEVIVPSRLPPRRRRRSRSLRPGSRPSAASIWRPLPQRARPPRRTASRRLQTLGRRAEPTRAHSRERRASAAVAAGQLDRRGNAGGSGPGTGRAGDATAWRPSDGGDSKAARTHLMAAIGREIEVAGPILSVARQRRLVALVGPTGVGKTTTIAKLAAHFRLREHRRVGLITVDTYRIAAVEQLRTYADIIDLPMEVASTPRRDAAGRGRLADLDLILMDTAGRSPRDEVRFKN